MNIGKIPHNLLDKYIFSDKLTREDILLYPDTGEDSAAIDIDGNIAVITCDPITAADKFSGYLSVIVVCNDLVATGAEPVGVLSTILMPQQSSVDDFIEIIGQIKKACSSYNLVLLGGHSEVTDVVKKPLIVSTGFGKVDKKYLISTKGAKPNDKIIITKSLCLEGSFILYNQKKHVLENILTEAEKKEVESFYDKLSVIEEGLIARKYATAMHDITEGGLFGALFELCCASNKGAIVYEDRINLRESVLKITDFFDINPYKFISSGSLLITTDRYEELIFEFDKNGIEYCIIGQITDEPIIKFVDKNNDIITIDSLDIDEIYKVV